MVNKKIKFTVTNISEMGPLELTIDKVQIQTKEGNKEVEKIFFCVEPSEREDIKSILKSKKSDGTENKTFELEYDIKDLEIEEEELFSCSKVAPEDPEEISFMSGIRRATHKLNSENELRIWDLNLIELKVAVEGEGSEKPEEEEPDENKNNKNNDKAEKQALVNQAITEITTKLQEAKNITKKECDELGNSWETDFRMWVDSSSPSEAEITATKQKSLKTIDEWIEKNKPSQQDQEEPDSPEPTPETPSTPQQHLDEAEQKLQQQAKADKVKLNQLLEQARGQTDPEQLATTLEAIEKLNQTKVYQAQITAINEQKERLFTTNAQKVRDLATQAIEQRLSQNHLQVTDLETETQAELEQLKTTITSLAELNTKQEAVLTKISQAGVKKELDSIIELVGKAKTATEKGQLKTRLEKLLVNSDQVWQSYLSQHQTEINKAFSALNTSSQSSSSSSSQPTGLSRGTKIGIGVAVGAGVIGLIGVLVVVCRRNKKE